MEEVIHDLETMRAALGTLEITSKRHNLDTLLGSMQILDRTIVKLNSIQDGENNQ